MIRRANPQNFNLNNYFDNGSKGCFPEVDPDYHDDLHDLHNYYYLAPEKNKSHKRNVSASIKNHKRIIFLLVNTKNLFLFLAIKKMQTPLSKLKTIV